MAAHPASCTLLSNNCDVKRVFKRMVRKWDSLYKKRAFTFWFLGEGLRSDGMFI
jgi:hypothetical protein